MDEECIGFASGMEVGYPVPYEDDYWNRSITTLGAHLMLVWVSIERVYSGRDHSDGTISISSCDLRQ